MAKRLLPWKNVPLHAGAGPTVFLLDDADRLAAEAVLDDAQHASPPLRMMPSIHSSLRLAPEKVGLLLGDGGEPLQALRDEFDARIDVNEEGRVDVHTFTPDQGAAVLDRIRALVRDVTVGDEFPAAKVVKTTTFGAFVELAKGIDGLLHISNVSPGARVATVEEVLNKGDEIAVRVVEVDEERGRIGLRLAEDPEIAGKTAEELVALNPGAEAVPPSRREGRVVPRRDPRTGRSTAWHTRDNRN
jgi:polyribonucleotide nucleotidyltransferase